MEVATEIVNKLKASIIFKEINIAEPGFINFKINPLAIVDNLKDILTQKNNYGKNKSFNNKTITMEEVNRLVEAFNNRSEHNEILPMEEKPDLDNTLHNSLTGEDPSARIEKYHTLTVKPKSIDLAGAILVKAVVEAE